MRDNGQTKNSGFNINGSVYGDFTPIQGLTVTSRFGYRLAGTRSNTVSQPFYGNAVQSRNYLDYSSSSSTSIYYQWENFANYMRQLGGHTITAMGNEDLKWETSGQLNFGFDGILFGGRTSPINAGNVENKGMGIDKGGYPASKKIVFGLNVEF